MIRNWKKAAAVIGALAVTATVLPALSSPASAAVLKPGISSGNGVTPAVANGFPGCQTGTTAYLWSGKSPGTQTTPDGVSITLTRTNQALPGDDSRYVNFQITGAKMVQTIVKTDVFFVGFITESTVYSYAPGVPSDTKIHPPTSSNNSPFKVDGYRFCYVRNQADLSITKSASTPSQNPGEAVTYTLTVANAGPDAATGVTVTDALPPNVTFVPGSASDGGTEAEGVVTWPPFPLPFTGSKTLTVDVTVNADAPGGVALTNSATVTGNETDPNLLNNSANDSGVTVNSRVDVEVTKTVSDTTPNIGDTVTYTITARNAEGNAAATGVVITDVLPDEVTPGTPTVPDSTTFSDGVWSIDSLAVGASTTLTIPVTITGAGGANIDNTANLTEVTQFDTNGDNNSSTASLTVNQAPIAGFTFEVDSLVDLLKVNFTDESSDQDGTIASWSWDFGDETTETDTSTFEDPTYLYPASGTYDVKLTVTDNDGGTNSITQPVEVRFEVAVPCSSDGIPADDVATTGPAAQAATFTRGDNNDGDGGVTNDCQNIGVTLQIDDEGVFLDKGTVGIGPDGTVQDVNSTLLINWTPLDTSSPTLNADLDREINFFPGEGSVFDIFVPVQWCLSSLDVDGTLTAMHPAAPPELAGAPGFTDGEVPWCLVSNTEELIDGKIVQEQLYHGKGDPRMR